VGSVSYVSLAQVKKLTVRSEEMDFLKGTTTMKKTIVIAALLALSFTTGFTCSKNTPEQQQPSAQEQTPPAATEAAPEATATPATGEQQPGAAAPTEAAPAQPAGETK
jgi:hypothetical protein